LEKITLFLKQFSNHKKVSLALLIALYGFTYAFFNVVFEDGDDVVMQQIAQGSLSGKPDDHLVFINIIIGFILKYFYQINSHFYWYSSMMVLFQFCSFLVILFYLNSIKKNWQLYVGVLAMMQYFIIKTQFTSIAGLLAIAGLLLFEKGFESSSKKKLVLSFGFLLLSALLRFQMALLMFFIGFIFIFVIHFKSFQINKTLVVFFGVLSISVFSTLQINNAYYADSEWQYYKNFNSIRGKINDNNNLEKYLAIEKISPIQSTSYKLATGFVYNENCNLTQLTDLYQKVKPSLWQGIKNNIQKIFYIIRNYDKRLEFYVNLLLLGLLYFLYKQKAGILFIPFLCFLLFCVYINFESTLKLRVFCPSLLLLLLFSSKNLDAKNSKTSGLLFCAVFFVYNSFYITTHQNQVNFNYPKDKMIIVIDNNGFSLHPFKLNVQNNYTNFVYHGWLTNNPLTLEKLRTYGFRVHQHLSIIDNVDLQKKALYYCQKDKINLFNSYLILNNKKLELIDSKNNLYKIIHL
jgi:hypothetical protein